MKVPHLLRGLNNFGRFFRVHRHGFFEQHVLARLQGVQGDTGVKVVGSGDSDGVDVRLIEQIVIIGVGTRDLVAVSGFLEAVGVDFGYGYSGGAWAMQDAVEMNKSETTGSNHRTTKSFVHNAIGELPVGSG